MSSFSVALLASSQFPASSVVFYMLMSLLSSGHKKPMGCDSPRFAPLSAPDASPWRAPWVGFSRRLPDIHLVIIAPNRFDTVVVSIKSLLQMRSTPVVLHIFTTPLGIARSRLHFCSSVFQRLCRPPPPFIT